MRVASPECVDWNDGPSSRLIHRDANLGLSSRNGTRCALSKSPLDARGEAKTFSNLSKVTLRATFFGGGETFRAYTPADMRSFLQLGAIGLLACSAATWCSAQSLGDVAREQQQKKASSSQSKPKHVITEDDIKSSSSSTTDPFQPKSAAPRTSTLSDDHAQSAADLQAKLKAQRERIAEVQASMKDLEKEMERWKTSDCTHVLYADTQQNACDIPQKLTADYEKAKEQLKAEQAKLDEIQEEARRSGYGSAFYERTN